MYFIGCRIILQHFEEYKNQIGLVSHHVPSKHSKEMASKSEIVSKTVTLQYCIIIKFDKRYRLGCYQIMKLS